MKIILPHLRDAILGMFLMAACAGVVASAVAWPWARAIVLLTLPLLCLGRACYVIIGMTRARRSGEVGAQRPAEQGCHSDGRSPREVGWARAALGGRTCGLRTQERGRSQASLQSIDKTASWKNPTLRGALDSSQRFEGVRLGERLDGAQCSGSRRCHVASSIG